MADSILTATLTYASTYATGVSQAAAFARQLQAGTCTQDNALVHMLDTLPAGGLRAGFCNELQRLMAAGLRAADDRTGGMTQAQLVRRFKARDALDELDAACAS